MGGDADLVDQLRGALGGPTPLLRPLTIDLEELGAVLEGDRAKGGGRIDLLTGEVWPQFALDDTDDLGDDDPDETDDAARWLWVEGEGSRPGYRDMELFIAGLGDLEAANQLGIAIEGRGAFRRFKQVLARRPELLDRWFGFSEDRRRGRARAWLADSGYSAAAPRYDR